MAIIHVISQDQLAEKFLEALQIITKLRVYKEKWDREHSAVNRNNLRRWEIKADEFMNSLNIEKDPYHSSVINKINQHPEQ